MWATVLVLGGCNGVAAEETGTQAEGSTAGDSTANVPTGSGTTVGGTSGGPTSDTPTVGDPSGDPSTGSSGGTTGEPPASALSLVVLSSRPDMVTGGDALVEVRFPAEVAGDEVSVLAGAVDVTDAFTLVDGRLLGVVEGLELGETVLAASAPGETTAELIINNYPIQGPMISGTHQAPFVCQTVASGLGAPLDGDCSVATKYEYFYKNAMNQFMPLVDPQQVPGDVQQVMGANGVMVDYVVRVERGTINRAVYQISALYDPAAPEWTATTPQPQWAGKVLYNFRGGCGVGRHQGTLAAADDLGAGVFLLADAPVASGYAVLSATLNTLGTNCNDVLTAETAMMAKERLIERYGVPRFTMGWGGSGGSIQQHSLAENYPGVLDGIVPMISYPDIMSIYPDIMDCPLFLYYLYFNSEGMYADVADQAAVTGFASEQTCISWNTNFGLFEDPTKGCDPSIPADQIYHPVNNPDGVRCTFVDNIINLLGTDPETGYARRVYDNVGVQYGLVALNEGTITKEQFLHINERIGGYGMDGGPQPARTAADPLALKAAYEGGRVVRGDLGLDAVPIVDLRYYTDLSGDIHDRVRTYSTRARLLRINGHFDNHVAFIAHQNAALQASFGAFLGMDVWLTALAAADKSDLPAAVVATRPPELVDLCMLDPNLDPMPGDCATELPIHRSPRMIAGAGLHNDTLKCVLKPIDLDDYEVTFNDVEQARLAAAFPDGVCDWEVAGSEQVPALGTWQSFGPRP